MRTLCWGRQNLFCFRSCFRVFGLFNVEAFLGVAITEESLHGLPVLAAGAEDK